MAWLKLNDETPEQFKLPFYADTPNGLLNVWRMEDEKSMMYFVQRILSILVKECCKI